MSALVDKAELASAGGRLDTGTSSGVVAAAAAAASLGPPVEIPPGGETTTPSAEPPKDPQIDPKIKPIKGERLGDEGQLSPKQREAVFSINVDADIQHRRDGNTGDGDGGDGRGTNAGSRFAPRENQSLQRQASSFESTCAGSIGSTPGGEERSAIGAFLLPEEEQVGHMDQCVHLDDGYDPFSFPIFPDERNEAYQAAAL